jgi:hypothetical protein
MKKYNQIIGILVFVLFTFSIDILGQQKEKDEADKQVAQKLTTLDLSDLKTNFLLNKGVFTTDEIETFRKPPRNKQGQVLMHDG